MSVGRRTPGRRNSWVIQIQFSPPSPPLFSVDASSLSWLWPEVAPPPLRSPATPPFVPAEALNPTPELPAARPIHQKRPSLSSVLWTNEPGVWRRTRCVCHVSVHSGGGAKGVGFWGKGRGLYLLQTVMTHKAVSSPSRYGFPLGTFWRITSALFWKEVDGARASTPTPSPLHQGHSAKTWWTAPGLICPPAPRIFLWSHICKLMGGN